VSNNLAQRLLETSSVERFARMEGLRLTWRSFAVLKREIDSLVHSDLNVAIRLADRIAKLAECVGQSDGKAFASACRARVLHLLGKHKQANAFYRSAIHGLRKMGLTTEAAIVQKQHVDALTLAGRYSDALATARQARRVLARAEPVHLAQLENNVGNIYNMLDRYRTALHHYDLAREVIVVAGDAKMRALVDLNRANAFAELDQPNQAMKMLNDSVRTLDRAGQAMLAAHVRYKIAYLHFLLGNYNAGLTGYVEARERLAQLGNSHLVAWCDLEMAEILLALNAFDEALQNAESARSRFNELRLTAESARTRMISALAAMGLGQFTAARRNLLAARRNFVRDRNAILTATTDAYLAEVALANGDARDALKRSQLAQKVFARQGLETRTAYTRLLAARAAFAGGDASRATRLAQRVLQVVTRTHAPSLAYVCHHLLGKIERDAGRSHAARRCFLRAVEIVDQMRGGIATDEFKASFLSGKIEVYEDAIRACLDEGSSKMLHEAFRLVESSKSRSLADLLTRYLHEAPRNARGRANGKDETRQRLRQLIADLNWYSSNANLENQRGGQRRAAVADRYAREITRCERQISQLFRRIQTAGGAETESGRVPEATVEQLQGSLEDDEAAIEYFTTRDDISAFVVTPEHVTVSRSIASRRSVEQVLSALRFQLEKFNYGATYANEYFEQLNSAANQCLARIYLDVFAPIERLVRGRRLILIPHGPLHYVPFHALVNRGGYLIDQFEISYAPSATVLRLCCERAVRTGARHATKTHARSGNAGTLVALGLEQDDLPGVTGEIESLAALFPGAVTLTGSDATRGNLLRQAPRARFLHLASHGYFRRDNPMFSFLKLADSQLNFYSLLDLKLSAELVTLSACHTGVNKVFPGDELHGLMRGFLHAGAPSLVASLWATSDASTAALMKQMYSGLRAGLPKRTALRDAQLAVKDEYGHPYYWAPFFLMGSPN